MCVLEPVLEAVLLAMLGHDNVPSVAKAHPFLLLALKRPQQTGAWARLVRVVGFLF